MAPLEEEEEEEDFTFPAASGGGGGGSPPHFIESPPLWRPSPSPTVVCQSPEKLKLQSFLEFEKEIGENEKVENFLGGEEEKMDVLWENLNDEWPRSCDDCSSSGTGVEMSCGKSLRLSRAGGQMFSSKKPIILVFIKVLKKVLMMQNSHGMKKQEWCDV